MTKEEALEKVKEDKDFLEKYQEWNNDKDVVIVKIREYGLGLQYVSKTLQNDKDVILAAIENNAENAFYIFDKLKNDKQFVLLAVKVNGLALEYMQHFNNDKEIVLEAIKQYSGSIEFASMNLRNDKEVVLAASREYGLGLFFASADLKKDKELILEIAKVNKYTCKYSLLKGYQTFEEIVEKEGEEFLFSCWNNLSVEVRLMVANHPKFIPTKEQIEIGIKDRNSETRQVYQLRQDEWLAKIEENKLRNSV